MADASRIPRQITSLNAYLQSTSTYLAQGTPNNGVRLGILPAEQTQWIAINTQWAPLFIKYSDKLNTRTKNVRDQLILLRGKLIDLDKTVHFLDRIAASPAATAVDLDIFNIRKKGLNNSTRSNVNTPIVENVSPVLTPIGSGMVSVKCFTPDSKRASILKGADSVQYTYCVGDTPPVSAEADGLKLGITSKASFTFSTGAINSGQTLHVYFRWYNIKRPENAGPWSALQSLLLL